MSTLKKRRCVVLLSGGIDSAVVLALAISRGYDPLVLTFRYGQRHAKEVRCAEKLATHFGVRTHRIIPLDLSFLEKSALISRRVRIPQNRGIRKILSGIPVTYVPARNAVFLAIAYGYAETEGASAIFIGAHTQDYSGYPDCTPEFLRAFEKALALGTKAGHEGRPIAIHAPLISMSKSQIIKMGADLGVPFEYTWSCYSGGKRACGRCDSCTLRLKGFREAGLTDPIPYL